MRGSHRDGQREGLASALRRARQPSVAFGSEIRPCMIRACSARRGP